MRRGALCKPLDVTGAWGTFSLSPHGGHGPPYESAEDGKGAGFAQIAGVGTPPPFGHLALPGEELSGHGFRALPSARGLDLKIVLGGGLMPPGLIFRCCPGDGDLEPGPLRGKF